LIAVFWLWVRSSVTGRIGRRGPDRGSHQRIGRATTVGNRQWRVNAVQTFG
jgi:hypothetical protein